MTAIAITANNISANEERGAILLRFQAGVTLTIGQAVYLDGTNLLQKAIATASATSRAIGMVVSANNFYGETTIPANDWATVCVSGPVQGFASLINGQQIWVSKTVAGGIDDTAPTTAYDWILAQAQGADTIFIRPGMTTPVSA